MCIRDRSKEEPIDYIVWVDPQKYYEYEYAKKPDVARLISRINQHFEDTDKKLMLLVPGRIGTSSPELGVPVVYAEISQFSAICEVAYGKAGYHPDLSYGSHMFQDLSLIHIFIHSKRPGIPSAWSFCNCCFLIFSILLFL